MYAKITKLEHEKDYAIYEFIIDGSEKCKIKIDLNTKEYDILGTNTPPNKARLFASKFVYGKDNLINLPTSTYIAIG